MITPYAANLWENRSVGLLGGSFNPAHEGHRHISLYALKTLGLDAVWWMVSPQNPMKPRNETAPLHERMKIAREVSNHPQIVVTDIESRMGTQYTVDTLRELKKRFARTHFVWIMGTDNLRQIHRWEKWQDIFRNVPVCVLDRPPQGNSIRSCPAIQRFQRYLIDPSAAPGLKTAKAPCWTILHIPLHPASSTEIRAQRKRKTS